MADSEKPAKKPGTDKSDKTVYQLSQPIKELEKEIGKLKELASEGEVNVTEEIKKLETKVKKLSRDSYANLTTWQRVQLAREQGRPYALDFIERMTDDFVEFHGDRFYSDDAAVVCGMAKFNGQTVAVIGQQKGRDVKENLKRNFAMMHPEGYRKALRVMRARCACGASMELTL